MKIYKYYIDISWLLDLKGDDEICVYYYSNSFVKRRRSKHLPE